MGTGRKLRSDGRAVREDSGRVEVTIVMASSLVYHGPMTKYFIILSVVLSIAALITHGGFALLNSLA